MPALWRGLVRRSGFALTGPARRGFRYLAQYYPPAYYRGYIEKVVGFHAILRSIDEGGIPGDVVECGVGRGLTFYMFGQFLTARSSERRLYGFDSFAGFPPPSAADTSPRAAVAGDLWADTSLSHVANHFLSSDLAGYFADKVRIVPGFFADTLPSHAEPAQIAFLNLDVDLYESYRECLLHLGPRVTGVIVYDEYRSPKWPGATRAIDEMLPTIAHRLFYARGMDRHVSVPERVMHERWVDRMIDRLELRDLA